MEELIERLRLLEDDHGPDGWPAVQMKDITAILNEIDRRFGIAGDLIIARRERDAAIETLRGVLNTTVGRDVLYKLTCGQGTATDDGAAWSAALKLMLTHNALFSGPPLRRAESTNTTDSTRSGGSV